MPSSIPISDRIKLNSPTWLSVKPVIIAILNGKPRINAAAPARNVFTESTRVAKIRIEIMLSIKNVTLSSYHHHTDQEEFPALCPCNLVQDPGQDVFCPEYYYCCNNYGFNEDLDH